MSLFTADVTVENVITTDPTKAKAVENDFRAKILDMLADDEMTIGEIHEELERRGEEKAETTVRHHVNILRDAGMVEISRLEEAGGGTQKYYRSNTRVFSYELPEETETILANAAEETRSEVESLIEGLSVNHGDEIRAVTEEMKPCEYCSTQHYQEYILRELFERTLTDLSEDGELDELLD